MQRIYDEGVKLPKEDKPDRFPLDLARLKDNG